MTDLTRRAALGGGVAATAAVAAPLPAYAEDYTKPFRGFAPAHTVLTETTPQAKGLDPRPIHRAIDQVISHQRALPGGHPLYPGHVGLMAHDGAIVARSVGGFAVRYATATTELPRARWERMRRDTIFDMASVSKLFTSIAAVQLIEEGRLRLEEPVATYLPDFAAEGKQSVTIRHLLTHTSGFTPSVPFHSKYPDKASRIRAVLAYPLDDPQGSVYRYSDLNLIVLGLVVESLRGAGLDAVVRDRITRPLGMVDTGYNPQQVKRTAATEYQSKPPRGMVRGEVHDENAWSFDGVAGHAGVFSTVDDLAILAQCLLNGGRYRKGRILNRDSVAQLITNFTTDFPGDDHGLGFELNQPWYMDALSGPRTAGHTGYTGTSFVIDFASRSFAILLTNRVHPSREWGSINVARGEWARGLALSMPIEAKGRHTVWESEAAHEATMTLTVPVTVTAGRGRLGFDMVAETDVADVLTVEVSHDQGATWSPIALTSHEPGETRGGEGRISGTPGVRQWHQMRGDLSAGQMLLRWRFVTDAKSLGRGVALSRIKVRGRGLVLDSDRHAGRFVARGWSRRRPQSSPR